MFFVNIPSMEKVQVFHIFFDRTKDDLNTDGYLKFLAIRLRSPRLESG
jgi:hypothetical protein